MTTVKDDRLLRTKEVAKRADISPITAKKWRAKGYGPPWIRLRGERGEIRYPESEYEKWVTGNLNRSLADEYAKRPQQEAPSSPKATPTFSMKDGKRSVRRGG
jgi:predicted DNA-binding transcriptional regulator AlpA